MKLLNDLLKRGDNWDSRQISLTGVALAFPVGGGCLCAAFMYRVFALRQAPDLMGLAQSLAVLGVAVGLSAAAHLTPKLFKRPGASPDQEKPNGQS